MGALNVSRVCPVPVQSLNTVDTGVAAHIMAMLTPEEVMAAQQADAQRDRVEADKQFAGAVDYISQSNKCNDDVGLLLVARAQVHATLALAAATMALGPHQ